VEEGHLTTGAFFWLVGCFALFDELSIFRQVRWSLLWPGTALAVGIIGFAYDESRECVTGGVGWIDSLRSAQVVQHKIAALAIAFGGLVELLRPLGIAQQSAWRYVLPAASAVVGGLLLVHGAHGHCLVPAGTPAHGGALTSGLGHPASRVRLQHALMALVCFALAMTTVGRAHRWIDRRAAGMLWPLECLLLGTLLVAYRE